ncbi:MAG: 50S ribosomal protein L35 [Coriobacteriia bacterium]|nr:50S ribosomal protein L35 [Coriobacteriia bacterium]
MPKMKTHKATAKRFRVTGTGKLMRGKAAKSHLNEKQSPKAKRKFDKAFEVAPSDRKVIARNLRLR